MNEGMDGFDSFDSFDSFDGLIDDFNVFDSFIPFDSFNEFIDDFTPFTPFVPFDVSTFSTVSSSFQGAIPQGSGAKQRAKSAGSSTPSRSASNSSAV